MAEQLKSTLTILRRKQVENRVGLSRSHIYARIKEGTFPKQVRLGGKRAVGWVETEIDAWVAARVEERGQAERAGQ